MEWYLMAYDMTCTINASPADDPYTNLPKLLATNFGHVTLLCQKIIRRRFCTLDRRPCEVVYCLFFAMPRWLC
jgi:hypothetical protein